MIETQRNVDECVQIHDTVVTRDCADKNVEWMARWPGRPPGPAEQTYKDDVIMCSEVKGYIAGRPPDPAVQTHKDDMIVLSEVKGYVAGRPPDPAEQTHEDDTIAKGYVAGRPPEPGVRATRS